MFEHDAPWSRSLLATSALGTALCLGIAAWTAVGMPAGPSWVAALPVAVVIVAGLFTVRRYTVYADALGITRLLWETRLPLQGLTALRHDPRAMHGSTRTFGNGGLFSFTGRFRNQRLGSYRAFVTDPARAVALVFRDRTVVVSPAEPERFVADVNSLQPLPRPLTASS